MTRWPPRNFRPDPALYEAAKVAAEAGGVNMNRLLQAMLLEFRNDPAGRLQALNAYLKAVDAETPPRGRPRKEAPPASEG